MPSPYRKSRPAMRLFSLSDALFSPQRSRYEEPPCTSINKSCGRCFYSACSRRQGPTDNASMDGSPYRKSPRDLLREYCWPNLSMGALPMGRSVTFLQSVHRARQSPIHDERAILFSRFVKRCPKPEPADTSRSHLPIDEYECKEHVPTLFQ